MGLFRDLGCLIGEITEATGEALDELVETSAGAARDMIEEASRPRKIRKIKKVTTYVVEEEEDLGRVLFGGSRWGRW